IVELRAADGEHRADMFELSRLVPKVVVSGEELATPAIVRRGPGLYTFEVRVPAGLGASAVTVGALFGGVDIVTPKSIPIATDAWTAAYSSRASGSRCAMGALPSSQGAASAFASGIALLLAGARRRRHSRSTVTSTPCDSHASSSGSNA